METNKLLAEIAIIGIFEGMQSHSKVIIDALEEQEINDITRLSLRTLELMSHDNYDAAENLLKPWCFDPKNSVDTPHAFLALALWRSGKVEEASQWCKQALSQCKDVTSQQLMNEIQKQIGG